MGSEKEVYLAITYVFFGREQLSTHYFPQFRSNNNGRHNAQAQQRHKEDYEALSPFRLKKKSYFSFDQKKCSFSSLARDSSHKNNK